MESSKITNNGQITIPITYRRLLNLKTGERVIFMIKDGNLVLKKAEGDPVKQLIGMGKNIFVTNLEEKLRDEWDQ